VNNGNTPRQIYVREARRIVGRKVFTENESMLGKGLKRAPVQSDSIGITDWFMDSHACTPAVAGTSLKEGTMLLNHLTWPGQISYQCLLPKEMENLLVPVCLSSSHVGWGAVRLEPTWMSIGEAAAFAALQAVKEGKTLDAINTDMLIRLLAKKGVMISFFNDVNVASDTPWLSAAQYFGTQGFFGSYAVKAKEPLKKPLADVWAKAFLQRDDPNRVAKASLEAEAMAGPAITVNEFMDLLPGKRTEAEKILEHLKIAPENLLTRGDACRLLFELQ